MNQIPQVVFLILFAANPASWCANEPPARIENARELWSGYDPRAEPLEIAVAKSWDEGAIRFEQLTFTGETWEGTKVRVFAYRGAPANGALLPGMLHLHGGGQTASLDWVRYWAGADTFV
jgi:acetyl esterase/lipase